MILSAASIIIVGGIKTLGVGWRLWRAQPDGRQQFGALRRQHDHLAVAIAIIPLILWFMRHGTIFTPDWRVKAVLLLRSSSPAC